ncbi:MAG TPA: sigma-E factor regulatory protein RseB domain-containing protein [Acidimicrobiia bacterium]|nr:sigma-E factor regulatory protein RseB domain-containing protein [Acidimicrobiia bacterium]
MIPARRVVLGCVVACSAVSALVPARPAAALPGPGAGAVETGAVELIDRAREAAETQAFDGVVTVEWRDGRTQHSDQVPVHSAGGVLRFGDEVVGAGARRMIRSTDGWLSLWGHDVATLGPSPTAKYRLAVEPGPDVAARPTDLVLVQLVGVDRLRERLYIDRQSGLLLRREILDSRGEPYRSVAFTSITGGAGSPTGGEAAATANTAVITPTHSQDPAPARHLAAPYKLKGRIGTGYRLVGAYKARANVVQQFFSDGLHGLSVFEQPGHLGAAETSLAGKSGSGREVEISGHTMRAYSSSVGEAVVWESDGMVYTAVTDAPWIDLAGAVRDLPHADPPGRLRRVAQAVVSLFRWR